MSIEPLHPTHPPRTPVIPRDTPVTDSILLPSRAQSRVSKTKMTAPLTSWLKVKSTLFVNKFGFWVSSSNRRNWMWPEFLSTSQLLTHEVLGTWQYIFDAHPDWDNIRVMLLEYKTRLPELQLDTRH